MKSANSIISHITNLPQFKLLKRYYCYQKFISILNPRFKKAIAFIYVRDETLFIALSHPGFKMEMNYNKDIFKNLLEMLAKMDEKCTTLSASKVLLFNSKNHIFSQDKPQYNSIPYYQEMALGEFSIESNDKELIQAFENIRQSIETQL